MATASSQVNIWQGGLTTVSLQIFDDNDVVRDLTSEGVTAIGYSIAKKSDRITVLESPTDGAGSIVEGASGKIQFTVLEASLDGKEPADFDVPTSQLYKPTPTLYGYVTLFAGTAIVDKIYIPNVAVYFETLAKV